MRVFNVLVSSTKAFITSAKCVLPQRQRYLSAAQINAFVSYFECGLEILRKRTETREKSFSKTSFQLRMDLKNGQKQGRAERTQEGYPTFAVVFLHMSGSPLVFFISALFLSFFRSILN